MIAPSTNISGLNGLLKTVISNTFWQWNNCQSIYGIHNSIIEMTSSETETKLGMHNSSTKSVDGINLIIVLYTY